MFKELYENMENFSRELVLIKKNYLWILELKSITTKLRLQWISLTVLDLAAELTELEGRATENIQIEAQREKVWNKEKRIWDI